jgi:hypothetical protein
MPCFGGRFCIHGNGEIYPKPCAFFVRKKYTTFSAERIVALQSVNNIFLESYDFAASRLDTMSVVYSATARLFHMYMDRSVQFQ